MTKLCFIIPMHKYKECVEEAIQSIKKQPIIKELTVNIILAGPKDELDKIKTNGIDKHYCDDGGDYFEPIEPSYQNLANIGLMSAVADHDWVSILEYDDALTPNAIRVFDRYSIMTDADVLAGLIATTRHDSGDQDVLVSVGNEGAFAPGLSEAFGVFDFNMMLRTNFLFVNGLFFRAKIFKEIGYLKPSFKMFYDYEFALRMCYFGLVIKAIPKLTHYHRLTDDGAYAHMKTQSKEESEFWLTSARKEYFFSEDRGLEFSKE